MNNGVEIINQIVAILRTYNGNKGESTTNFIYHLQHMISDIAFTAIDCPGEAYYIMLKAIQNKSNDKHVTRKSNETI